MNATQGEKRTTGCGSAIGSDPQGQDDSDRARHESQSNGSDPPLNNASLVALVPLPLEADSTLSSSSLAQK